MGGGRPSSLDPHRHGGSARYPGLHVVTSSIVRAWSYQQRGPSDIVSREDSAMGTKPDHAAAGHLDAVPNSRIHHPGWLDSVHLFHITGSSNREFEIVLAPVPPYAGTLLHRSSPVSLLYSSIDKPGGIVAMRDGAKCNADSQYSTGLRVVVLRCQSITTYIVCEKR